MALDVQEEDGAPHSHAPETLKVPNGSLSVIGSVATLTFPYLSAYWPCIGGIATGNWSLGIYTITAAQFIIDANTYISKDGSGNITFTDAVTGTKTLAELDCPDPKHLYIFALTQSEGNLNLSDSTNWPTSKAMITIISVKTSSTNWLLDLYPDDDFDELGVVPSFRAMGDSSGIIGGNGNANLFIWCNYEDYDGTNEVHITFTDLSGANTADIRIYGEKLR